MMVKEIAHKRPCHHDHQGKDQEEKAGAPAHAQTSGIHGDKGQHAAVGKKHKTSQDDGRKGSFFYEITDMETFLPFSARQDGFIGQFLSISCHHGSQRQQGQENKERMGSQVIHNQKSHQRPDDHGHITADCKITDALSLTPPGKHKSCHGRRGSGAQSKHGAMDKAEKPHRMKRRGKVEAGHEQEKQERRSQKKFLLVYPINNPSRQGPAEYRADLEAGHGHACLPLPLP